MYNKKKEIEIDEAMEKALKKMPFEIKKIQFILWIVKLFKWRW